MGPLPININESSGRRDLSVPGRLLQFMSFLHMLQRVPCAWLDVADPDATADLIEHGLEDSWH